MAARQGWEGVLLSAPSPTHLLQMRSETERVVVVDLAQPPPPDEAPGLAPSGIALEGRV